MSHITPSSLNIKTCFQSHYSLPYFQREYKWEVKHFSEMLNDIQETFLVNFDPAHGRRDVASYTPYFLGSIITSGEVGGKKPLVDGQQRLTSIFLLLSFLERYSREHNIPNRPDVTNLLGSMNYGVRDYSIEFSEKRQQLLGHYLDFDMTHEDAMIKIEGMPEIDDSDRKIIEAIRSIDRELDDTVKRHMAFFMDYLIEKYF